MEIKKKNLLIFSIVNFFKGIIFGIANVIPGVSGGTMAVIMGIFEGIISSVNSMFKSKKQFVAAVIYLLPIVLGALTGILAFATLLSYCLENFSLPTNIFFAGLVAGSIPNLIFIIYPGLKKKKIKAGETGADAEIKDENAASEGIGGNKDKGFKAWHILPLLAAAALVVSMAFITPTAQDVTKFTAWQYALLPVVGFVAAVTMIIPGVSGSFMLKLMGWYTLILNAASLSSFNLAILGLFAVGVILGVLAAARIIDFLFKRFKTVTYLVILGLVAGCIAAIFIQGDTYISGTGVWGIVAGIVLGVVGAALALTLGSSKEGSFIKTSGEANENTDGETDGK